MRWFGDDWNTADDERRQRVSDDYRRHVSVIADSLPEGLRLLVEGGGSISLHDGQIMSVFTEDDAQDTLVLDIYAGEDHPPEPALISVLHVRIVYRGAELASPELSELRRLIRDPKTDILHGEIDATGDGKFEHRLALWTGKGADGSEVVVRFEDADVIPVRFQGSAVTVIDAG